MHIRVCTHAQIHTELAEPLPCQLCFVSVWHNKEEWYTTKQRTLVDKQNFQGKFDGNNHQQRGLAEEKRTLCGCCLIKYPKEHFLLLKHNLNKHCFHPSATVWPALCITEDGAMTNQLFGGQLLCANVWNGSQYWEQFDGGIPKHWETQDVYELLPRSVSEISVCISYHRGLKHKHYRLLTSNKSDEILFP